MVSARYKYGINNLIIFESDEEIENDWLPALGSNVQLIETDSSRLTQPETIQKLTKDYITICVSGVLPSTQLRSFNTAHFSTLVFFNKSIGLFLTSESTTIKPPLKPNSTLRQLIGKNESILKLDIGISSSKIGRRVQVNESSKSIVCSSIPFTFW